MRYGNDFSRPPRRRRCERSPAARRPSGSASATPICGKSRSPARPPSRPKPPAAAASTRSSRSTNCAGTLSRTRGKTYLPTRQDGEHLQVIAVTNFKGGSGKTTTAAHLSQFLALRGFRVLAIDLDPQASLSALFGYQPETDIGAGETLYGAVRYEATRPLTDIIRPTYFAGLDLVPGNLELQEFEHETPRALAGLHRTKESAVLRPHRHGASPASPTATTSSSSTARRSSVS